MPPARHTTKDIAAASGMSIHRVSQLADRGILLSPGDVPAGGTGRRRRYTDATLRKAILMQALDDAGIPPSRAGNIAEAHHSAKVKPGDLLIVDRRGGSRIANAQFYQPGASAAIVLDVGQLFAALAA
jgi:hypothetical protein